MDDAGSGILQGSLPGRLFQGASLLPGLFGQALHTNGTNQYAEFPLDGSNACLQNPDSCSTGITFTLWFVNLGWNSGQMSTIYDSDGCSSVGMGFCFGLDSDFWVTIRCRSLAYRYRIPSLPINIWHYITISFKPSESIRFYVNGCDTSAYRITTGYQLISPNSVLWDLGSTFRFGGRTFSANMKLDHVLIWYHTLSADDIWKLYRQEGIFRTT